MVLAFVGAYLLLDRLSGVLLPFFLAWLIAYLLFPLVKFFQYRCKMRFRVLAILCALLTNRKFTVVMPNGTSQTVNYNGKEVAVQLSL